MLVAVKVRLASTDPAEVDRICAELGRRGLRVRRRLPPLALATGDAEETRLDDLRAAPGVLAVEPEGGARALDD